MYRLRRATMPVQSGSGAADSGLADTMRAAPSSRPCPIPNRRAEQQSNTKRRMLAGSPRVTMRPPHEQQGMGNGCRGHMMPAAREDGCPATIVVAIEKEKPTAQTVACSQSLLAGIRQPVIGVIGVRGRCPWSNVPRPASSNRPPADLTDRLPWAKRATGRPKLGRCSKTSAVRRRARSPSAHL